MSVSSVLSFSILWLQFRLQCLSVLHPLAPVPSPASHCSPSSGSSSVSSVSLFSILQLQFRLQRLIILHPLAPVLSPASHCSPSSGSSSVRLQRLIVLHPPAPVPSPAAHCPPSSSSSSVSSVSLFSILWLPVFCGPNLLSSLAQSRTLIILCQSLLGATMKSCQHTFLENLKRTKQVQSFIVLQNKFLSRITV